MRTLERWRGTHPVGDRHGRKHAPANHFTDAERRTSCSTVTSLAYRDLLPHQIVLCLADQRQYIGLESTLHRVLRAKALPTRRGRAMPPTVWLVTAQVADGPNQVWSWDITYLPTPERGVFLYLYLILDVWSRKIVGAHVCETESDAHTAALLTRTCQRAQLDFRAWCCVATTAGR